MWNLKPLPIARFFGIKMSFVMIPANFSHVCSSASKNQSLARISSQMYSVLLWIEPNHVNVWAPIATQAWYPSQTRTQGLQWLLRPDCPAGPSHQSVSSDAGIVSAWTHGFLFLEILYYLLSPDLKPTHYVIFWQIACMNSPHNSKG